MGAYSVFHSDVGQNVYGKPAYFRPFLNTMQYMQYSPEKEEYVNHSIIFKNWKEEAIDIQGGTRCGKIPQREWEKLGLTNEELAEEIVNAIRAYVNAFINDTTDPADATATATLQSYITNQINAAVEEAVAEITPEDGFT